MSPTNTTLPYYETLDLASKAMLAAARNGDWGKLSDTELCCAAVVARLRSIDTHDGELDASALGRKRDIIRSLMIEDAEIRDLAQPWLRSLDHHLGRKSSRRERMR